MSVHGLKHANTAILPEILPAAKQGGKSGSTNSSFSSLLGSLGTAKAQQTAAASKTPSEPVSSSDSGFSALFGNYSTLKSTPIEKTTATTPTTTATPADPSTGGGAAAPFVATYEQNATETGPDGSVSSLNSMELATSSTAAEVAQLLGGTVVNDAPNGSYTSSVPTREISVPGSNVELNAGLVANLFSTYGTQSGSFAWQQIDSDLGMNVTPPAGSGS